METRRFCFGESGLPLLHELRASLESEGFECTVEITTVRHFVLHILVARPPFKPTRAERGCNL